MPIYNLAGQFQLRQAEERFNLLKKRGARCELTEKRPRTLRQNNYLHLIISFFALSVGETAEYVKRTYYKTHCNPQLFLREKRDSVIGYTVSYLRSTAELTAEEMTLSIERFRNFASEEAGIYIPSAGEHEALLEVEEQVSRTKQYV